MKDIFIDNNIAKNFSNPIDVEYKNLIQWINDYDEDGVKNNKKKKEDFAHLVVNQKLLVEYNRSAMNCFHNTSIPVLIAILTRQGRLVRLDNNEIKEFKNKVFTKSILRNIASNEEDHCHICSIISSNRKMALTYDVNLTKDLLNFPGHNIIVSDRPEKINYKK